MRTRVISFTVATVIITALATTGAAQRSAGVRGGPATGVADLGVAGRSSATPSIAAEGRSVVVAWSASAAAGATDIYLSSSADGGRAFGSPVRVNDVAGSASVSGEQPPRVALVPHPGGPSSVVVVWTAKSPSGTRIVTARSDDGGKSFGKSRILPGGDAAGNRGWESISVGRDGHVSVIWLDHRELASGASSAMKMPMNHEMPAGHVMPAHPPEADGAEKAQLSKLYFADLDGGAARSLTGGVCYCCKTSLAAGPDGSLYAVWRHVYPGNIRDIAFTMSRDGGKTFANPLRVSEDKWMLDGCPENGPALAVRGQDVHVVWPTLVGGSGGAGGRGAASAEPTLALFYAGTHDGRTFTARQRIPTDGVPRHPQIAIAANGSLLVAWDESVSGGGRRVVLARTGIDTSRGVPFTRQVIADNQSAQYPVVARTGDGAVVAWTSGAGAASVIRVMQIGS